MKTNLASALVELAEAHGESEALVDGAVRIGHAETVRRSAVVAERLAAQGIKPGDRVAILLPNGWQFAISYCAAQLAGAIVVLANTRLTAPELEQIFDDAGISLVITDDVLRDKVPDSYVDRIVNADELTADSGAEPSGPVTELPGLQRDSSDVAQLLYTSGTTGRPKGAMQTQENLLFNARTVRERVGAKPGERTLIAAPMFHATGVASQFVGFLTAGATCVLTSVFKPESAVDLMARERITFFAGVTTMLRLIMLRAVDTAADLSALRLFVMGGSPVPETFPAEVKAELPELNLGNVWGLTEGTSIVTYTDGAEYLEHPATVGKPVAGVEVAISKGGEPPQDLREVTGELCVRGPIVAAGYWNNPEATAATFADGWLHTGDIGIIDADGSVRVLDRMKDMIIRGGENVYSLEVENALLEHPEIAEVAVVGVPDPIFDERVRAVVVPRPDSNLTADDVREHAANSLAKYKVPAEVHFVSELPRNAAGKILKRQLGGLDADGSK